MKRFVICVAGKIGTGKSTAAKILAEILNARIIDVDRAGHEALKREDVVEKIKEVFGEKIIKNGEVDRKILREIVFSNEKLLKKLEEILHPVMVKMVEEEVRNCQNTVIIDCALLKRMKLDGMCDLIITIKSFYETAKSRKPHIPEEIFRKIRESQRDIEDMGEVIWNEGEKENLKKEIIKVLKNHQLYPQKAFHDE
ncbi:MAG: dephospho-CoA kinase [Thermotogaceae bacterium]|nr:dephospho-CoA kinase [Thermotogaceae bacterium]